MTLNSPANRATLRGLKGFEVLIEDIAPEAKEDGLTKDLIKTDVELRLRKAGIRVLTKEESPKIPQSQYLYINVIAGKHKESEFYSIAIFVDLKQEVYLKRNPSITVLASTWSVATVGGVSASQMKSNVREQLGDLMDKFINAYLAVNPK